MERFQEEKFRHHQQYPEYRYQPRRNGRVNSVSDAQGMKSATPCYKCGGHNMASPTTPATAGLPKPILPPITSTGTRDTNSMQQLATMNRLSLVSPNHPKEHQLKRHYPSHINVPPLAAVHHSMHTDASTPDSKRRRLTNPNFTPGYVPTPARAQFNTFNASPSPYRDAFGRAPSVTAMHPPGRAVYSSAQVKAEASDLPLRLPPLQTSGMKIEDVVKIMPLLYKMKVLGKVAPPMKAKASDQEVRGSVIAVEGDDAGATHAILNWLLDFLSKSGDFAPKTTQGTPDFETGSAVTKADYLGFIQEWHIKSAKISNFVTSACVEKDGVLPVMVIQRYQLHAADTYACQIPIEDTYSATDHWQWIATLWRGIIGPDLTVYVKDCTTEQVRAEAIVEVVSDARCIFIKREKGQQDVDEKDLRRLGFEIGEWIRNVVQTTVVEKEKDKDEVERTND